jgi:hypothetical protein
MDPLKALGDHRTHPKEPCALGRPVARGSRAVFLSGQHDERGPLLQVAHRRVVDRHRVRLRAIFAQIHGHTAFGARCEKVAQPDVRESAAHHHLVVPAPRAVGVEVSWLHAVLDEVAPGRAVALDRAGR